MNLLLLLLSINPAFASDWKQVWEAKIPGQPKAAFFYVGNSQIYVSAAEKGKAVLYRVSESGKVEQDALVEEAGEPGPLRASGDRIFWAVEKNIYSFSPEGKKKKMESTSPESPLDLAIDGAGKVYVAGASGLRLGEQTLLASEVRGLFFLGHNLFALEGGRLVVDVLSSEKSVKPLKICENSCTGLERNPNGSWITADNNSVMAISSKKTILLKGSSRLGKPAYIYRRESRDDLLVVPFPAEGFVRAYKAP